LIDPLDLDEREELLKEILDLKPINDPIDKIIFSMSSES
jgi:hypothetical protein